MVDENIWGMKDLIEGKYLWKGNIWERKTFGGGKHLRKGNIWERKTFGRKDLIEGKHLGPPGEAENIWG